MTGMLILHCLDRVGSFFEGWGELQCPGNSWPALLRKWHWQIRSSWVSRCSSQNIHWIHYSEVDSLFIHHQNSLMAYPYVFISKYLHISKFYTLIGIYHCWLHHSSGDLIIPSLSSRSFLSCLVELPLPPLLTKGAREQVSEDSRYVDAALLDPQATASSSWHVSNSTSCSTCLACYRTPLPSFSPILVGVFTFKKYDALPSSILHRNTRSLCISSPSRRSFSVVMSWCCWLRLASTCSWPPKFPSWRLWSRDVPPSSWAAACRYRQEPCS